MRRLLTGCRRLSVRIASTSVARLCLLPNRDEPVQFVAILRRKRLDELIHAAHEDARFRFAVENAERPKCPAFFVCDGDVFRFAQ